MVDAEPPRGASTRSALSSVREFFAPRAATWDERFPDDAPVFDEAVRALRLPEGGTVLDAGCGTGRAIERLREAVGPSGCVVAIDATPEMLDAATRAGRLRFGALVLGDGAEPPIRGAVFDGVLAAGFIPHLTDPLAGLRNLAGVTRDGGHLAVFHPVSRAMLAERHGRSLSPDDIRAPDNMRAALETTGWDLLEIDDGDRHYLALARRVR